MLRSSPLARNDSVDVIIGTGIVLVLPSGFGSVPSSDRSIVLPVVFLKHCLFVFALCFFTNSGSSAVAQLTTCKILTSNHMNVSVQITMKNGTTSIGFGKLFIHRHYLLD